jgi:hypothetical protein
MNPSVKAKWVAALRSGEYKQAVGRLRWKPSGGFCCMGVLCDLYHKETGKGSWEFQESDPKQVGQIVGGVYTFMGADGYAPPEVCEWAGLIQPTRPTSELHHIAKMNDHHQKSFAVIAKHIEENL